MSTRVRIVRPRRTGGPVDRAGTRADDYVVKPLTAREVVLRVEALLRRAEHLTGNRLLTETLSIGDFTIDLATHVATRGGSQLSLTSREFDLLTFLAANPGQTFSKADLLHRVGGWDFGDTSTVTVHVRRLRERWRTIQPIHAWCSRSGARVTAWSVREG